MNLGANDIRTSAMTTVPRWPTETYQKIIEIGFAGRLIDNIEHIVIKRLRGLV
jgi:hypothetical protein